MATFRRHTVRGDDFSSLPTCSLSWIVFSNNWIIDVPFYFLFRMLWGSRRVVQVSGGMQLWRRHRSLESDCAQPSRLSARYRSHRAVWRRYQDLYIIISHIIYSEPKCAYCYRNITYWLIKCIILHCYSFDPVIIQLSLNNIVWAVNLSAQNSLQTVIKRTNVCM